MARDEDVRRRKATLSYLRFKIARPGGREGRQALNYLPCMEVGKTRREGGKASSELFTLDGGWPDSQKGGREGKHWIIYLVWRLARPPGGREGRQALDYLPWMKVGKSARREGGAAGRELEECLPLLGVETNQHVHKP